MPSNITIEEGIYRNQRKECVWCGRPRFQISRYCMSCKQGMYRWGHPYGKKLPTNLYTRHLEECRDILNRNQNRPDVQLALKVCQVFLDKASQGSHLVPNPSNFISGIAMNGATAEEVFLTSAAIYAFCAESGFNQWNPTYQIGGAIITLRRFDRLGNRILGHHREKVGSYIMKSIGPVFEKFVEAIRAKEKAKAEYDSIINNNEPLKVGNNNG